MSKSKYALELSYAEMDLVKELAIKKLNKILFDKKQMNWFTWYISNENAIKNLDIIPCVEEWILGKIIYRCFEIENIIKEDLKRK